MFDRPLVILPSENQSREFDAKLLLACALAERGHDVVVGARHVIHNHIAEFRPGIYVAKDFRKPSERILDVIAGLGHHIVAWDEEGLVQPKPDLYYQRRYSLDAIKHVQSVFAWGEANCRLMEGAPQWPRIPIHKTGNPRLDMLRRELRQFYESEVERIRRANGRYVLFNSNFASFNPALESNPTPLFEKGAPLSPYLSGRKQLFERWQNLLPRLAKTISPISLIVRPHPAESDRVWKEISASHENFKVVREGSAIEWILSSEMVLHSGCTTGLEAALLEHTVFAFRPENLIPIRDDLPDALSTVCQSEDELISNVQESLREAGRRKLATVQQAISRDAAFAQDGPLASDRIAAVLGTLQPRSEPQMAAILKAHLRQFEKWLTKYIPNHKTSDASNLVRYPGTSIEVTAEKIVRLKATLKRFDRVTAVPVRANLHLITGPKRTV
jgi:surface carbohydrate biosynthesis protein